MWILQQRGKWGKRFFKVGQTFLQSEAAFLYYKVGQMLLQGRVVITK